MRLSTWLAALALAVAHAGTMADERPSRSALIVGISTYSTPQLTPLPGVPHDVASARRIAAAMGIAAARTTVLLDAQATKANIVAALESLARDAAEGDRTLVYFSGHGTRWFEPALGACKAGLITYDWQTIGNDEIARHTQRLGEVADKVIVMFDACFSDGVNVLKGRARALTPPGLRPKYLARTPADSKVCATPSNLRTRDLVVEATRLGALRENFVQITSSRADEVSFDDADRGGIATQAVRDCLLGEAVDVDGSGAVSMHEVEACAQASANRRLAPYPDLGPQHITVAGNRNLVPVAVVRPPAAAPAASAPIVPPSGQQPPTALPVPAPNPPPAGPADSTEPPVRPPASLPPAVAAPLASLATLTEIEAQRNPRRRVEVALGRPKLRIGHDRLELTLRSSHAGFVYVVLLGSDATSFYLLFPNAYDADNRIAAGQTLHLPRPDWALTARGPAGTDRMLVLVTDTPRSLAGLPLAAADSAAPFTYVLTDLPGRSALIDYLTGAGVSGRSESFGAHLLALEEVP